MQLLGLMGTFSDVLDWVGSNIEIDSTTPDSDRVESGQLHVALPAASEDGNCRVHQAPWRGAVAVLGNGLPAICPGICPGEASTLVQVRDVVKAWFWLCNNWAHLCKLGADPAHDHTDGSSAGLLVSVLR